jgi:hypothetical protein
MTDHRKVIMPIAAALGALAGTLPATNANAAASPNPAVANPTPAAPTGQQHTLVSTGNDLLAFIVTEQPDGTIIAQHASHASHASHHSHYSSR